MTRNIWDHERKQLLKDITSEFLEEGYGRKEAKEMARREVAELMADKMNVVDEVFDGDYE